MKTSTKTRAVAAVVLMALIVLTLIFIATGNFNLYTKITAFPLGFLFFVELSLLCSLL